MKVDLPRRAVEQVGTSDDVGHAQRVVVNHHCQLIGELAISPAHHEVASVAAQGLRDAALQAVVEADRAVVHAHPQGSRRAAAGALAASAGVDRPVDALQRRVGDLAAAAGARVDVVRQLGQGRLVGGDTLALPDHRSVVRQSKGCQRVENGLGGAVCAAWRVEVFDAQVPGAADRARVQPAGQRGEQ